KPLSGSIDNRLVTVQGDESSQRREAGMNSVSADYFQTLSIQIIRGRAFDSEEVHSRAPVVVVSETTANQFWPGQDPLGQQIGIEDQTLDAHYNQYGVIGIARDTRSRHVWQKDGPFIYLPATDTKSRYLLVQTRTNSAPTMSTVRSLAAAIDPALRISVQRLDESLSVQTVPFRALAWVSGALGMLALVLASLGLYGVTSFLVARRTHEIGIRIALGARRRDVVGLFLRGGLRLTAIGIVLGLAGGVALSRLLVSVLVDLNPADPFVFGFVVLFLFAVALVAILAATRRATKVDPIVALRYE
ncbi:MAG TPA: FtsX-like permease family protein, partial [Pyrinomonadaceae bacterium]|nr:FtsX-like permease family protein [Pyrinomonadaceae bacterium]